MTPERAIEILNMGAMFIKHKILGCNRNCRDCESMRTDSEVFEMCDIAKAAIERCMVAKKPTHEASLLRCCTCPKCKNVIDKFEKFGEATVRVTYDYCHFCGQKIDWSDVL